MAYHGVTKEMAKEFCRDYLGTLKTKKLNTNQFRSIREIASIMEIDFNRCHDFVVVAKINQFLTEDPYDLPPYMIPVCHLYKVWESHLA